ncbi:hypothetical protein [Nodosilinea nodulosa]|uniref:hypothetical protein n=1 Tax=Nodosilinea nodulosa TaxID=416001 RepID=UPI00030A075F|nr:hypothetical protein [Nodosilinea nodulosa]
MEFMIAFFGFKGFQLRSSNRWRRFARQLGIALAASFLLAIPGHPVQGQAISAATVTEILDSNQVYIQNRAAQVNSVAQQRQQVRTQDARASLRFNNGAVARLAHNSSLVIGQCAQLNRGTLLVNGALNGCSTSTLAGVRGTIYTIEVTEAGETTIQVFEGTVVVTKNPDPEPVEPMVDGFDPIDPSQDPMVPSTDPVVPFANPVEPSPGPSEVPPGPGSGPEPPPTDPGNPAPDPLTPAPNPLTSPTGYPINYRPGSAVANGLLLFKTKQADDKQGASYGSTNLTAGLPPETAEQVEQEEPVGFTANDSLTIAEGQQVTIDPEQEQAVIRELLPEDFTDLLEGPLINGFAVEIPGMGNLRRAFEQLFPGVPLPYYWAPSIPTPPIRFPFPF